MSERILLVDDDERFALSLTELLKSMEYQVHHAPDVGQARDALATSQFDWLLLDLMLPDGSGLELLDAKGDGRVVVMTGDSAVRGSISSLEGPQLAFLQKPVSFKDLQRVLESSSGDDGDADPIRGTSAAIVSLRREIERVAVKDVAVFVSGESGVGKELVAESIHRQSGRTGRFVAVNCGATNAELLASQLFGHEKGSFTGAAGRHHGFFERASGGTLFLDEVSEMPIDQQATLLRALENGRITRLGGQEEIDVDVRVVSACNRDPQQAIEDGQLREDLFFRLAVFPILVPPLRERGEDIEVLAQHFLEEFNRGHGTHLTLGDEAVRRLRAHHWPGNVRELRHVVQRAFILAEPDDEELSISEQQLRPFGVNRARGELPVGKSIREVEKAMILRTLEAQDGDKRTAAKILGISLKTLYNRLNEYQSEDGD